MKTKTFYCFLMALCLLGSFSLASCNDDDNIEIKNTEYPEVDDVQVEISNTETLTANELADKIFGPEGSNADEETQNMRQEFLERCQQEADAYAAKTGQNGLVTLFHTVDYNYWSDDEKGHGIKLSARVMWGQFGISVFGYTLADDLDPNNIYLMEWYDETQITDKSKAPSQYWGLSHSMFHDNLVIMPDHIGFGTSDYKDYPFLMNDLNAKNSIDALKAGLKVFKEEKQSDCDLEKDWKFYVLGCDIGAGNALAVHKYLDTHSELADSWRFEYSYLGGGTFCPSASMDYYLDDGRIKYRAYFPLLFKSMIANFPDIMKYVNGTAIKEEDFYTDEYLKIKPEIDKMFAEKKYTLDVIDEKIRELLGIDKDDEFYGEDIDKILNSKMFNKYSSIRKALYKCFDKCNLTTGWTPKHKIETFCVSSGLFSYRESEALKNAFQDKVTYQYLFSKTAYSIFYKTVFNADW